MAYETTFHDMFELSGKPANGMTMTYQGGDAAYPVQFGPIIEPLTFQTAQQGLVLRGDTVTLDGTVWTVTGFGEGNVNKFEGDPATTSAVNGNLQFVYLSDGTTEKYLAIEQDYFADTFRDNLGPDAEVRYISIWYYDTGNNLNHKYHSADNDNTLHAICFATGTMIETAAGPRPVQSLRVGDLVRTRDNGLQPLRWLGGRRLSAEDLARAPRLLPIRIAAGALGPGMPAQDLTVSPQHRMLVRSPIAARMAGQAELLVAAVHLLDLPGVSRCAGTGGVGYWHLMFDAHEIVFANGAEAESLYLGPMAMEALTPDARAEITALFPELAGQGDTRPLARPVMRGGQCRKLVERQVRNRKPLVAPLA